MLRAFSYALLGGFGLISFTSGLIAQQAKEVPAFLVVELNVKQADEFNSGYGKLVGALVTQHGGSVVIGGQKAEALEGSPPNGVIIVVRFDNIEKAKSFLDDPAYKRIVPVRQKTADTRSYLVRGSGN